MLKWWVHERSRKIYTNKSGDELKFRYSCINYLNEEN